MFRKRVLLVLGVFGSALVAAHLPVGAQDFSQKPITIVVPYSAGGPTDVSARSLADEMAKALGANVIIENKPSAGGIVAATSVAKAPKDGHTLLLSNATITVTNPSLYRKLPYKVSDFAPIALYSQHAYAISLPASSPVKTVPELIAYAKSKPEGLTVATVGHGTQSHIIAEWLGRRLGINVVLVPYKGVSQAQADLIAGRVDILTDGISSAMATHRSGHTRILASMGQKKGPPLPEGVPTFSEVGYPDLYAYADFGLVAPAGTPELVLRKLHAAVATAVNGNPAIAEKMRARGEEPAVSESPAAYAEFIRKETVRWDELIKPLNLTLD
jgi:tripartite-type tricarboxylate transporter receptor subunit TctC